MRIKQISHEIMDKMAECRSRGHGKWITDPGGFIVCYDCAEVLFCLAPPEEMNWVDWEDLEDPDLTKAAISDF